MPQYITANPRKRITTNTLGEILEKSYELGHALWVQALIVLAWAYGIRRGEIYKLRKKDLKVLDGFLYIDSVPLKNPSKPDRELPLSVDTPYLDILLHYIDKLEDKDSLLPMSVKTFYRRLKKIDPELSPHVFRHNRGTELPFQTDNPYEIMSWMGHSDLRTALKYMHGSSRLAQRLGHKMTIK